MAIDFTEISFVSPFFCLLDRYCKDPSWGGRSVKVAQFDLQSLKMMDIERVPN